MKKLFDLCLICLLLTTNGFSQVPKIKKQINEAFFELNPAATKYDVRKTLHASENFTDVSEFENDETADKRFDIIEAEFKLNYKLSYLNNSTRRNLSFWFDKGTDVNYSYSFTLYYPSKYVVDASQQFSELTNFFKTISYKTSLEPFIWNGVKQGEIFYGYSSLKSYQNNKFYLIIINQYAVIGENINIPPPGKYYETSLTFYNKSLY